VHDEIELREKTILRDVGNGFIILGLILLVVYFALLIIAFSIYAEEGWKVWTFPSMFGLATAVIIFLLFVGVILRYLPSSPSEVQTQKAREE
jgi:ABC-type transport system involved in multi-copper enzyme maturation permease subunit